MPPKPAPPESANDLVYKALMEHKKAEMQRMTTLASDTRTITEAMLRKQVFSPFISHVNPLAVFNP